MADDLAESNDKEPAGERAFTLKDRFSCLFRREFYSIIPFYLLVLIPSASLIAWGCRTHLDPLIAGHLSWWRFPGIYPWNILLFIIILFLSGAGLLWTYSYLILEGRGGPCPPFTATTQRLVTTGPYAYVRHPSIIFKLMGVTGLGIAFESLSFILVVIPVLLSASLYLNVKYQEKPLDNRLDGKYEEYREKTPAIIPVKKKS